MNASVTYEGRELEAMSFALNYHRWMLEIFAPYLGRRLVEVGAGAGSFSELLLERPFDSLALVEPSRETYALLEQNLAALRADERVKSYNAVFRQAAEALSAAARPDSIIYINVLEHIADDEGELRAVRETLAPGGRVLVFVPALPWLYGSFDRLIQHQRRYAKAELEQKCAAAGFRVLLSRYFDMVGVLPWWVKYRLLKSETMEAGAVRFYDRFVVPVARVAEGLVAPPVGKNIILVAEKV